MRLEIDPTKYPNLVAEIDSTLPKLNAACENIRVHRNRRIAHADLNTIRSQNLPPVSFREVKDALSSVTATMQAVEGTLWDRETSYDNLMLRGGVDELIKILKLGAEKQKEMRRRHL